MLQEVELMNLNLRATYMSAQLAAAVCHDLSELVHLEYLNLSGNDLSLVSSLTLSNKKNLTHLDLSCNPCKKHKHMSAQLADVVICELSELVHLKYLDLSCNDLSEVSSLTLSNKKNLTHLDLRLTQMSAQLAAAVYHELNELVHLEHLNLSKNDLSEVSSLTLNNKKSLRYLNLSYTHMSADLCRSICHQLNELLNLEKINLSGNTLTGCLSSFVPDPHPGLPQLK